MKRACWLEEVGGALEKRRRQKIMALRGILGRQCEEFGSLHTPPAGVRFRLAARSRSEKLWAK